PDWSRDRIMAEVSAAGVPCYSGSCSEIYLEKAFDSLRKAEVDSRLRGNDVDEQVEMPGLENRLPVAKELGETSLMLLVHPTLSAENINDTIRVVKDIVTRATK
ncbi:MAG: DegT/DnrJ/EryC1/StrS aminotransferase family protein, partial [Candidatus Riflebacteria bacterium]|nr:DegT/DnrJ/EryC1/StrS aminotransferase family protein [Candidatus Riflebacteria bacterium]